MHAATTAPPLSAAFNLANALSCLYHHPIWTGLSLIRSVIWGSNIPERLLHLHAPKPRYKMRSGLSGLWLSITSPGHCEGEFCTKTS